VELWVRGAGEQESRRAGGKGSTASVCRGTSLIRKPSPPRTGAWGPMVAPGGGRFLMSEVQGCLAHKKAPPPMTLQWAYASGPIVVLLWSYGGGRFPMSEVHLYCVKPLRLFLKSLRLFLKLHQLFLRGACRGHAPCTCRNTRSDFPECKVTLDE